MKLVRENSLEKKLVKTDNDTKWRITMDTQKLVALTFDDGPTNITEKILDILEEKKVLATFFLIGQNIVPERKATMERELALGCEIANHSYTHSDMSQMDAETIRKEIGDTTALIKEMVNVDPKFFRPPYLAMSDTMFDNIDLPFITGKDSKDWDASTTTQDRINTVLDFVTDGTLVLMHDFFGNEKTVEAIPVIIDKLREDGYEFVTASQIFERKGIDPKVPHKAWYNVFE